MNINMWGTKCKTVFLIIFSGAVLSCNRDRNDPGWDYFPDMAYSTAYETFSRNPNFGNDMTMRVPPEGTVPRGYEPFEYSADIESRARAGRELVNPVAPSAEAIQRGKEIFTTFCIGCHGAGGQGDGHLYKSGLYPLKPLSLVAGSAIDLKDGAIFHTITLGFGPMGAHGTQIRPDDRWKLILYIRQLQERVKNVAVTKEGDKK